MKVVSSLKSLKKRDLNNKLIKRKGKLYVINKKNPRMKFKTRLMDIKDQKETWNGFTKLATICGIIIVLILVMMAFFLV